MFPKHEPEIGEVKNPRSVEVRPSHAHPPLHRLNARSKPKDGPTEKNTKMNEVSEHP